MAFNQLICIQFILIIVSHQVLANPAITDLSDALVNTNQNVYPSRALVYDNLEEYLSNADRDENLRQQLFNRFSKRRAKANLAGLWGVPTKFA
ncbi:unnamed protein product [Adineta steineri]|uniref:Uncharacterized protein n=1 Tax=Adineta steineri TaxID=433720 RepID=A0A813ZRM2_9BILA|nr:unnamed protein product [Adineta steineri]CAF3711609.1 unnamed protein product [Adineta steineri]